MAITTKPFGTTSAGAPVTLITLQEGSCTAQVLDYGCILHALTVPARGGKPVDVVLGYDSMAGYIENKGCYLGAVVGRHANRIGKGCFTLGGREYRLACNNGVNHLHGGDKGFDSHLWDFVQDQQANAVTLTRTSPDGEEGYPGTLAVSVTYTLRGGALRIDYNAVSDADTVVNLTNHSYFNLCGGGNVLGHTLCVNAQSFTPNDSGCLPTGELRAVEGTPFDFRMAKEIGRDIASDYEQVALFGGYDHNLVLAGSGLRAVAELYAPQSGIAMQVETTKPGMQLYTANVLGEHTGKGGVQYAKHGAVCLETQFFPNAMLCSNFPTPVLRAGDKYNHTTIYSFTVR